MFKRVIVVLAILLFVTFDVQAADYSFVKGGAFGQLSSSSVLATYFYARAGERLAVVSDKTGLVCNIMGLTYDQKELNVKENSLYTAPYDDLYILICFRPYGYGNGLIGVITLP